MTNDPQNTVDLKNIEKLGDLPRNELFYNFTRSLRKYCDSPPTTSLYCLSMIDCPEIYQAFMSLCDKAWAHMTDGSFTRPSIAFSIAYRELETGQTAAINLIHSLMRTFNDNDWHQIGIEIEQAADIYPRD